MEVADRIHRVEAPLGERIVCVYLLVGEDRLLIIDAGLADTPSGFINPYLDRRRITSETPPCVLISHADNDHFGGNRPLKQSMRGGLFMCHALDQPFIEDVELLISDRYDEWATGHNLPMDEAAKAWVRDTTQPVPIDLLLQGGEQLRLGPGWYVDVLHTPGHSRGHLTVYDAERRAAIIADAALWNSLPDTDGQPVLPPTYRYVTSYIATLNHLLQLPISLLLTSHFPVFRDQDATDFLAGSLDYVRRVDQTLERTLKSAGTAHSLQQLIEELSPKLGDWPDSAANFLTHPLTGHLERMERYGKVERAQRQGTVFYQWRG